MSARAEKPLSVHRLIQRMGRDPGLQQRFAADPANVFEEFGLTGEEIAALKDGSISALAKIGVDPMLRMHWQLISNPEAASRMSVAEYMSKIRAGAVNG